MPVSPTLHVPLATGSEYILLEGLVELATVVLIGGSAMATLAASELPLWTLTRLEDCQFTTVSGLGISVG